MNKNTEINKGRIIVILMTVMLILVLSIYMSKSNVADESFEVSGVQYKDQNKTSIQTIDNNEYDEIPIAREPFEIPCDSELGYDILYTTTRVNVRTEPNDSSEIVYTLSTGEMVKIYGNVGNDIWSWTIDPDTGDKLYICGLFLCWDKPDENEYTEEDLELLARLVYSENGSYGRLCMLYTGSVVLNRVASNRFPDTIYDVIYQDGQYEVTWNGTINKIPSDEAYDVAEELLKYGSVLPPNVIWQAEFDQGDGLYRKIGKTKFCYSNNY